MCTDIVTEPHQLTPVPQSGEIEPLPGYGGPCRLCGQTAMAGRERDAFRGGLCFPCFMRVRDEEKAAWAERDAELFDADVERDLCVRFGITPEGLKAAS